MEKENELYLNEIFPDLNFLKMSYLPYEKIKDNCIFVLDTNALLAPYRASSKSFDDIKAIFKRLKQAKRLKIPFRVLQEYARNRGNCLKDQYSHFDKMSSSNGPGIMDLDLQIIPLLQTNEHFKNLHKITTDIADLLKKRSQEIAAILEDIKKLYWDDPIFQFYKEFIDDDLVVALTEEEMKDIRKDMKHRYECEIPPGFADKNKADGGIGDLIIWRSILSLGTTNNVVFVSNDRSKNDWFYVSEVDKKKAPVAPRFELLVEFSGQCKNSNLDFMDFTTFLETQEAKSETIHELSIDLSTPYNVISEEEFIVELSDAFYRFNSTGGFLASRYFIETYLATKGYDIRASWNMYYRLKEKGVFSEYLYQDINKQYPPQNVINLVQH